MPLQNRVDPFGNLFADKSRGLLMGNRGGRIHDAGQNIGARRWSSRQWICCVLDFHDRHRTVWGDGYTELFFLDEPTAFAAGHRPCFECRHADALSFARMFAPGAERSRAPAMDLALHAERLDGKVKRLHRRVLDGLPDGAFVTFGGKDAFAVKGTELLHWTSSGYRGVKPRPRGVTIDVLTSPSILRVLAKGYRPRWHPSAS